VDEAWDTKVKDGITCMVHQDSITCKYMVGTQKFIITFYNSRWHHAGRILIPLDQDMEDFGENLIMDLDLWINNEVITILKIRSSLFVD